MSEHDVYLRIAVALDLGLGIGIERGSSGAALAVLTAQQALQ